jgi:predicted RNA-binding protein with PUA-like domain
MFTVGTIWSPRKKALWDGVRNHAAALNMKTMKKGDLAFFYHSNIGVEVVGIIKISKKPLSIPTDEKGKFVAVKVKPVRKLKNPVPLKAVKANPKLAEMDLVRLSRLSVGKVRPESGVRFCRWRGRRFDFVRRKKERRKKDFGSRRVRGDPQSPQRKFSAKRR